MKGFFQALRIPCCIFDLLSIDIYIRGIDLDLNVLLDDRAFLYSALVLLLAAASAAGQDILLDFPDYYPVVSADEDRIRQVLINLVSNAVKYAPQGNITISGTGEMQNMYAGSAPWYGIREKIKNVMHKSWKDNCYALNPTKMENHTVQ